MDLDSLFDDASTTIPGPYSGLSTGSDMSNFPDIYGLTHFLADLDVFSLSENSLVLGVDGQGEFLTMDLSADNPHALISAGSGGGKSATLRALAAQCLAKGYRVIILDVKRHSHMWAEDLPNVLMARSIREIGNALRMIGLDVHNRNRVAETWLRTQREAGNWDVDISDAPVGPRTVVLYEEMNSTHEDLASMTREKFRNSSEYTGIQGFKDSVNLGRAAKIHFICVGQYMSGAAMGKNATEGTALRENFNTRILVKHSPNAWKMLAWDCGYPLAAPEERGRAYLCRSGKARMIQLLYLSEREAQEFAAKHSSATLTASVTPELA